MSDKEEIKSCPSCGSGDIVNPGEDTRACKDCYLVMRASRWDDMLRREDIHAELMELVKIIQGWGEDSLRDYVGGLAYIRIIEKLAYKYAPVVHQMSDAAKLDCSKEDTDDKV